MTSTADPSSRFLVAGAARGCIAALAFLLTVCLQVLPGAATVGLGDEWLRDRAIGLHASSRPETRILVVDIDERSLTEIGPWPWPRERIAALLENLYDPYHAAGVALDLVLPEKADADGDLRLAMLAAHAPLVLAAAFDYDPLRLPALRVGQIGDGGVAAAPGGTAQAPLPHQPLPLPQSSFLPSRQPSALPTPQQFSLSTSVSIPLPMPQQAIVATGYIGNHAGLAGARRIGNIGFIPDADGVIRRLPLQTRFGARLYPTLSLALYRCCAASAVAPAAPAMLRTATTQIPGNPLWRIPYTRRWEAYTVVSAADILAARVPAALLRDRLVLVGSSSLGLADRVATPLAASTSGLLVHAAALSTMLDLRDGSAPASWPGGLLASAFALALALLAALSFPRLPAAANVLLLGCAAALWLALADAIAPHDANAMLSAPLLSILFLLVVAIPFDWQITQRKSRRLLGTLHQYVARSVVTELLRSDLKDALTPTEREVTTLIADMEGYTTHVSALPVKEAAQLTRDFLDCLTRPVLAKSGTLDKYTGDGLVAFWGAPLPDAEHADLALDAAREIVLEVRRYSQERERRGLPGLRVRIGIESGLAMAGDFGSAFRSIYTAVGDSVNVASRLEQLARDYPYDVIVGPGTAATARRHALRPLGGVVLRGREQPTALYALEVGA